MLLGNDNLRNLAKRARVDKDPYISAMIDSPVLAGPRLEKFTKYLCRLAAARCPKPHVFLPAPSRQQAEAGVAPIGGIVTGHGPEYWFRAKAEEATGGTLVCAPTGGGKTLLLARFALDLHRQGYPVWVWDSEGDMTRYLVRGAPDILMPSYREFRQELFQPYPDTDLDWNEHLSKVISSWRGPLFLGDGMANMSREIATGLHERQGHFTPYEFTEALLRRKHRLSSREGNYFEALKNRFTGMILPSLGPTYSGGAHDLRTMLQRSLVWQLQGLAEDTLSFFATELLLEISLISKVLPGMHLGNLQVFDEFTRFCSLEQMRRATAGEIFFLDFVRTCRKRQIGVAVSTQTPHLLPPQVLSDMNTWIVFRPADGRYLQCVSQALNLDADQEDALMELSDREPRQVVVRCPGVSSPFLVELPQQDLEWATAEEIADRQEQTRRWLAGIYRPPERRPAATAEESASPGPLFVPREYPISKPLLDYMVICAEDWALSVTARDRKHDISPGLGNRHRKRLAEEGMLRLHRVLTGRRGGQMQVTEVTEEGYRLLDQFGVHVGRPPGRGGFEHRLWQYIVHSWAVRQGYPSQIEQEIAGKPVDVGVTWEEKRVAVEIVFEGLEKELSNLAKDLERGWDQVVFCTVQQETLDRLKDTVMEEFGEELISQDKVRFRRLHEFLEHGGKPPSSQN